MQVAKHYLFNDRGSCCIETSPLICSKNQWTGFCIIGTSVMKDLRRSSSTYTESLLLHVVKHNLLFFSIWLFFHEYSRFTGQQVKRKAISLYLFYHFHLLHKHLGISWVIAEARSPEIKHETFGTSSLEFTLSTLALVDAVVRKMFKTRVTLRSVSCVLLNLTKRLIFVMFKDSSSSEFSRS